ncbi:MAG: hypothetical protein ABIL68_05915 [bacterium]
MAEHENPKVTKSSKKEDIYEAYKQLVKQMEEKRESETKPEQKAEEKRVQEAVRTADDLSIDGVSRSMNQLKAEFGKSLGDIMDGLERELSKYQEVKKALEAREKELSEIYEIQKAASSLAALVESQKQQREEFEKEMETRRREWEREEALFESEMGEKREQQEKQWKREREEWEYLFKREQQIARDGLADEKSKMEKELKAKTEEAEKALSEREMALAQREEKIGALEGRIVELEKDREEAVEHAIKETTDKLQSEYRTKETLLQKDFEGERNVMLARIGTLEETVKTQNAQIAKLTQQMEKAAAQVQDMAVKVVEGASRSKLLDRMESLAQEERRSPEAKKNKSE